MKNYTLKVKEIFIKKYVNNQNWYTLVILAKRMLRKRFSFEKYTTNICSKNYRDFQHFNNAFAYHQQ